MFEFEKEFHSILKNLQEIGALRHLILIGSWVIYSPKIYMLTHGDNKVSE